MTAAIDVLPTRFAPVAGKSAPEPVDTPPMVGSGATPPPAPPPVPVVGGSVVGGSVVTTVLVPHTNQ